MFNFPFRISFSSMHSREHKEHSYNAPLVPFRRIVPSLVRPLPALGLPGGYSGLFENISFTLTLMTFIIMATVTEIISFTPDQGKAFILVHSRLSMSRPLTLEVFVMRATEAAIISSALEQCLRGEGKCKFKMSNLFGRFLGFPY